MTIRLGISWSKCIQIVSIFIIFSCQNQSKERVNVNSPKKTIDTTFFNFIYQQSKEKTEYESYINTVANKLTKTDSRYSVDKIGEIKKESSIVYKAIVNKPRVHFSSRNYSKINSLDKFKNSIYKISYARMKVQNSNTSEDSFSKVVIEEILFHNEDDAKTLMDYIQYVKTNEHFWNTLDKTKGDIFRFEDQGHLYKPHSLAKMEFF